MQRLPRIEMEKCFTLDPKHLANFNIYFYPCLLEQSEALKNYEEFYKVHYNKLTPATKAKWDPLSLFNICHDFFIALIRESIIKTDMILFLINMLKFKHFNEFVDKEVEELAVEILVILIRHSIFLKSMNKMDEWVNYIGEVLNIHQDFFKSIKTNPIYNILGQLYIEFIEEDITDTVEQQQKLKNDKKKKSEDKKAKLKKRKEMAMLKIIPTQTSSPSQGGEVYVEVSRMYLPYIPLS